jgi:hypothetical protein
MPIQHYLDFYGVQMTGDTIAQLSVLGPLLIVNESHKLQPAQLRLRLTHIDILGASFDILGDPTSTH